MESNRIIGEHITLTPRDNDEFDVVVDGDLFHATRGTNSIDLLKWIYERLYRRSMRGVIIGPNGEISGKIKQE